MVARVTVDHDRCVGAGMCVFAVPEVFDQSEDDGRSVVRRSELTAAELADVREVATTLCPSGAVRIFLEADAAAEGHPGPPPTSTD